MSDKELSRLEILRDLTSGLPSRRSSRLSSERAKKFFARALAEIA